MPEPIKTGQFEVKNQFRKKRTTIMLRLKMTITSVKSVANAEGAKYQEEVAANAVYSGDQKSANAQWSKWTPCAQLTMSISNPDAFGKVLPGQFVFVDITPTDKDSL